MNKFDERYEIRLGNKTDIPQIMEFIDKYWKKGHILSQDRELFEYEFLDGDIVNIVLAIDRNTLQIEGIFGILYCSHIIRKENRDIWGSLWKVVDEHDNIPFLGVELAKRAYDLTGCRMHIGNGANPKTTIPLRRLFFGDKTAKMKQYYYLNPMFQEYKVCNIQEYKQKKHIEPNKLESVMEISTMEELKSVFNIENIDTYPFKDNWYLEKRYFKHPYYTYKLYALMVKNKAIAVVICRELEVDGTKILRIIDYLGEHEIFSETGNFWHELMKKHQYEYVDFFEFGIKDEILESAGFVFRNENDKNIIPNYFEPFLQENVDIWVHYELDGTTFFKGDCDQDRPNVYRKKE